MRILCYSRLAAQLVPRTLMRSSVEEMHKISDGHDTDGVEQRHAVNLEGLKVPYSAVWNRFG